jgi:adenylate cyclase
VGLVTWFVWPGEPTREITSEQDPLLPLPAGPVIAVLPFENLSRHPDQEYFSDGLTDEIITELSRFKDLFVIARNSTLRYKGQPVDVRQLRTELGAHYVLEGSVQRVGDSLRVTAQLLDARDGTHLWAETYDRELSAGNVFAVQDEITGQVVATIAGISGVISRARFAEIKEKPTDRLDAYEWVLKAAAYEKLYYYLAPQHEEIRDGLERAVESDPGYADAWAWLSLIYTREHKYDYSGRPNPLDHALEAARRAISLDPSSQRARDALAKAYFFRRELDAFLAEAERTIALNPNDAWTLATLGNLLVNVADERGISFVRKAVALDPFHPTWFYFGIALHHCDRGEFEEALPAARKIDTTGDFWHPIFLAVIYTELGRGSEASSALQELFRLRPDFSVEKYIEEERKWNRPEEQIRRWAAALRKAGLPE